MGFTYRRMIVAAAVACAVASMLVAGSAFAEGPAMSEKELFRDNFDSGTTQLTLAGKPGGDPPFTAYWGPSIEPTSSYSGNYALWAAGTDAAGNPSWLNRYPDGTKGTATRTVTGFQDMYSGHVSFRYTCEAVGGADTESTQIHLFAPTPQDHYWTLPQTSKWDLVSFDTAGSVVISREPLTLQFVFTDQAEAGGTGAGDPIGPSIDDLVVSGFKYGPVGNLQAVPSGTNVALSWTKPKKGPLNAADDERAVAYRVYKRIKGGVWTELTSTRTAALSWNDTTGMVAGNIYEFAVQAWDTGTGPDWGKPVVAEVAYQTNLDSQNPVVTIVSPTNGQSYSYAEINFTATDNVGVTSLVATLDGTAIQNGAVVTDAGVHTLQVTAQDAAGHSDTKSVTFTIDNVPPTITVSGVTEGQTLQKATPTISLSDGSIVYAKLDGVDYPATGRLVSALGPHTLNVVAEDASHNRASKTVHFTIDNPGPTITITGVTAGGTHPLGTGAIYTATDDDGVASLTAKLDGAAYVSGTPINNPGSRSLVVSAVDSLGHASSKTVNFSVQGAGTLVLSGPSVAGYASNVTLTGTAFVGSTPLPTTQRVYLQDSTDGVNWRPISASTFPSTAGTFSFSVLPNGKTYYLASTGVPYKGTSNVIVVVPKTSVSTPVAPSSMKKSKYYVVYGTLKPLHTASGYYVRIYKYKKVSGKWKSYGYVNAKLTRSTMTTSKYSVKMRLTSKGSWRLRARAVADSRHADTWSTKYDYVKVK
ncbi:MAG TPA: hypothetical protein VFG89_04760 [Coriobacteriia bacterium]|nr:hypothetical protein [Coriobacteriia bacterium]